MLYVVLLSLDMLRMRLCIYVPRRQIGAVNGCANIVAANTIRAVMQAQLARALVEEAVIWKW